MTLSGQIHASANLPSEEMVWKLTTVGFSKGLKLCGNSFSFISYVSAGVISSLDVSESARFTVRYAL